MSQYILSSPPSTTENALWDPVQTLGLRPLSDGTYLCTGIKNGNTGPCNYGLRDNQARNINDTLDIIETLSPQAAIPHLNSLASLSFCHHHRARQCRRKLIEWTRIVNDMPTPSQSPPPPSVASSISELASPMPTYGRVFTPESASSRRGRDLSPSPSPSPASQASSSRPAYASSTATTPEKESVDDTIQSLEDEIERLTARVASLKAGQKEAMTVNAIPQRNLRERSERTRVIATIGRIPAGRAEI